MIACIRRLISDRRGVTALEYGVIAATTVVALSAVMTPLGTALNTVFTTITAAL